MRPIVLFIRATLTGGIIFLLPFVLLMVLLARAVALLMKVSGPISKRMPEIMFGLDGSNLVAIFLLVVICFISGLLFRSARVKKGVEKLEENVLSYLPGYALIKSITADAVGQQVEHNMKPVLIRDGESWGVGFLVEEGKELSTVFIPDAPRYDAGEIRIVPAHAVRKLDVSSNKFARSINTFGKGAIHWVK